MNFPPPSHGGADFGVCSNFTTNNNNNMIHNPSHILNYSSNSTTSAVMMTNPSSTSMIMTSGGLSESCFSNSHLTNLPSSPPSLHHQNQENLSSSPLCIYSGLPFPQPPPQPLHTPLTPPTTPITSATTYYNPPPSMEDNAANLWIDTIIKDLINTSSNVSVPQLIFNIRDIISNTASAPSLVLSLSYSPPPWIQVFRGKIIKTCMD